MVGNACANWNVEFAPQARSELNKVVISLLQLYFSDLCYWSESYWNGPTHSCAESLNLRKSKTKITRLWELVVNLLGLHNHVFDDNILDVFAAGLPLAKVDGFNAIHAKDSASIFSRRSRNGFLPCMRIRSELSGIWIGQHIRILRSFKVSNLK